ncbi:unnamed protein product [Angiostrongylus costaricensis]|uniref:Endo/exonuclease/phosphatase domain-containing protein n=1 Tax=Angiostrongylus costaricensis TaxID=334426 RepID=A0A0R3PD39_ANGCS|nr:unnamed protein product [Angiostrongylus costaricensis]
MTIRTYNARPLASKYCTEDSIMQAIWIRCDVIGVAETRRRRPFDTVYHHRRRTVSRNMRQWKKRSFKQLTTQIGRLRMKTCGSILALIIFVVYAPTSSCGDEVEALYVDLEKFHREAHIFFNDIIGDFNAKPGPRKRLKNPKLEPTDQNGTSSVNGYRSLS